MNSSQDAATSDTESMKQPLSVEKVSNAFAKVRREVSEDEFTSPGVPRILLEQLEDLRGFRDRFHKADKERDILQEKLKLRISSEVIFGFVLTIGSLLIGFCPNLWGNAYLGELTLVVGAVLIVIAVIVQLIGPR